MVLFDDLIKGNIFHYCIDDLLLILQKYKAEEQGAKSLILHAHLLAHGLETHQLLGNHLVPMLVDAGELPLAHRAFARLPHPNAFSWNSLISAYATRGEPRLALSLFSRMEDASVHPDDHTFVSAFKACSHLKDLKRAFELHTKAVKLSLSERNIVVGNALIDLYIKCNAPARARQVFDSLPLKNVITWTSLVGGFIDCGHYLKAMELYKKMTFHGVIPNPITFVCVLKACTNTDDIANGQKVHAEIERRSLLDDDVFLGSALVDMYAKYGLLTFAQHIFDKLPSHNVVSWNSLMQGYIQYDKYKEAVRCFIQMQAEGICLTDISFICVIKACGSIGCIQRLEEIHAEIDRRGLLQSNLLVGSTLVNMYAKCGSLASAQYVFDNLPYKDVVTWTALLAGYAQAGECKRAANFFDQMLGAGIKPDPIVFVVVLNACSRVGLFEKSETYFQAMGKDHGILPFREHYSCIVDLLGRTGHMDSAQAMLCQLPCDPNLVVWRTILSACSSLGNFHLAKQVFSHQEKFLDSLFL
ncbi:hypothetical protein KP509_22G034400 [Ceratopteris richardii]|uniref:Pentatricopeptide repeat-containing protein n=1 Tax=Ceratopteris richardii TaxID=49495 RepID=A0A8T2S3W6_CERRI|nr:hypothetical protein KP509_22G034400 [Ceratopteris richardii]